MEHLGVTVNDVLQATLQDGKALLVRPILSDDVPFLQAFFSRLPLSKWENHTIVKMHAYQARQEDVTTHTLRPSFAKNLVDAGKPLDQAVVLLGHERTDTTWIYTQPSESDLEQD